MAESRKVIYAAIAANVAIAVSKFTAAAFTGSSAMISEGIHSLVDTCDGGLLLLGIHKSEKPPDAEHPFGYGKELYFWSLIVALAAYFKNPNFDGAASILIGIILTAVSVLLAYETKGLFIGESADRETLNDLQRLAESDPGVEAVKRMLTMHFGPNRVLLTMDLRFRNELSAAEVEQSVSRLEATIRKHHDSIEDIFIEYDSFSSKRKVRQHETS